MMMHNASQDVALFLGGRGGAGIQADGEIFISCGKSNKCFFIALNFCTTVM